MAKKIAAVKLKPAASKRAAKAAAPKKKALSVSIDYPQEGEVVRSGHYSIRLTAAASAVQVRIGGGDWLDCRESVGHYWLDWMTATGDALIEARARSGKGRWSAVSARAVSVIDGWATN
jgi:hypothetical protein